jgi:flagellar basal-body rod protein FlgB
MDPTRIGLLDLAEQRLSWTDRRQAVLAQNIANANTPGFKPRDLRPFGATLAATLAVAPERTQPNHLAGTTGVAAPDEAIDRTHTQSPDGNAVALDEQLVKGGRNRDPAYARDHHLQEIHGHAHNGAWP